MAFPERFAAGPERRHGPQTERGAEHGTNAASRRLNAPADRLLKSGWFRHRETESFYASRQI